MIVGTAGHIDHGKTRLVRALTGIDTDRLKEEKARGISIELGYAYVPLEGDAAAGEMLGFVDVPGHERFVHTMVAGATGIDFALLVIAADDGVMPQTREHLAILAWLGVERGAIALTKVDRVDAARLAEVRAQVAALLAGTPLRDAPSFACDSTDPADAGIAALRAYLHAQAAGAAGRQGASAHEELFRLPIDRVFTLPGHGTMVAGPVHGGRAEVGANLRLMPQGIAVRIRSIHAQNRAAAAAEAGQRCALNLASIGRDAISRGDWIADPRAFLPSPRVDVRLHLDADAPPLRDWTPLHVHWGTMHRLAHAVVLDGGQASPGGTRSMLVQLVFDAPVCAMTGDHFIVRNAGATATLGGGVVLDADPPQRRRRSPARLAWLAALERLAAGDGIEALLRQSPLGLSMAALARHCRLPAQRIVLPADARHVEGRDDGHAILLTHWQALCDQVLESLRTWHQRRPDEPGVDSGRLQRSTLPGLAPALWQALLHELQANGRIQRNGAWWHLPGHDTPLPERERALLPELLPLLSAGGFDPPWVRTLAAQTGADEELVRATLRHAAARGEVFQVVSDLFYHPQRIAELAGTLGALARTHGAVEAALFRDAIGLGRKRSIQILEFFDRVGYTRRVGDSHRLRNDMQWNAAP